MGTMDCGGNYTPHNNGFSGTDSAPSTADAKMHVREMFVWLPRFEIRNKRWMIGKVYKAEILQKDALIKEGTDKIEELTTVLKEASEEIKVLREDKLSAVEDKVKVFEAALVDKLNRFLDYKVNKELVPATLIESQAKLEVLEPLVELLVTGTGKPVINIERPV